MQSKIEFTGFDELLKTLHSIGHVKAKGIWRKAARAGASIVLKAVRPMVPKELGVLAKAHAIRIKARRRDGVIVAVIGPRRKFKKVVAGKMRHASMYAHLAHGGRKAFTATSKATGKSWKVPAAKPNPYLARALNATASQVIAAIREKITSELERNALRR